MSDLANMTVAQRNKYFDRQARRFSAFCRDLDRRAEAARKSGKNHTLDDNYEICTRCRRAFKDLVAHEIIECEAA